MSRVFIKPKDAKDLDVDWIIQLVAEDPANAVPRTPQMRSGQMYEPQLELETPLSICTLISYVGRQNRPSPPPPIIGNQDSH